MTNNIKRHDWEDALVQAQVDGLIKDGALLLALKLAKAINWNPKNGRPAGLYWKNEDAFEAVGIARATYFRHRQSLFETGCFKDEGGNLIPCLPAESQIETNTKSTESVESQIETTESQIETTQSQIETGKSQIDNPLSVDTLSEDVLDVDEWNETAASAPVVPLSESKEAASPNPSFEVTTGAAGQDDSPLPEPSLDAVGESRQSQIETAPVRDGDYWRELRKKRPLTREEKDEIYAGAAAYRKAQEPPVVDESPSW